MDSLTFPREAFHGPQETKTVAIDFGMHFVHNINNENIIAIYAININLQCRLLLYFKPMPLSMNVSLGIGYPCPAGPFI